MVSFGRKCNFTRGLNVGMVVTFIVVESSIVQLESPLSWFVLAFIEKNSSRKNNIILWT